MNNQKKTILLAEDQEDEYYKFYKAANSIFSEIDIIRLANGYDALSYLQTTKLIDAIFLDVHMPFKNGLQLLKEIREMERYNNVPIIILTRSGYSLSIKLAYQLKATFFAEKPPDELHYRQMLEFIFKSEYFVSRKQPPEQEFYIPVYGKDN